MAAVTFVARTVTGYPNARSPCPLAAYPRPSVTQACASVNDARGQVRHWADRRAARRYARPLEQPGGGREPCSPGQRGPLVHHRCPANTAGGVRLGGEPGPLRAPRFSRPSRAGAARAAGFRAPLARAGHASGGGALAPRRRRGAARRDRLCGPPCDSGGPAVGTGAKTTRRGLVTTGSPRRPRGPWTPSALAAFAESATSQDPADEGPSDTPVPFDPPGSLTPAGRLPSPSNCG